MRFEPRPDLEGMHAFMSPSSPAWINYDDDKLESRYLARRAAQRGTELHKLAHDLIRLGVRLPNTQATLNRYVNDGIRWKMQTEITLFYSMICFGTADAISFNEVKRVLRVSDLKTGVNEASFTQLEGYAALFCLQYGWKPFEIATELRIYQNDAVKEVLADPDRITHIMDRIKTHDLFINNLRKELE